MDATDLWRALYRNAHGLLECRVMVEGRSVPQRLYVPVHDWTYQQAQSFVQRHDARGLVAYGVQPRWRQGGKRQDVWAAVALVADLDCADEESRARAEAKLYAFELPYSALVCSGHGLHVYWFLRSPLVMTGRAGAANQSRFEMVARRLAEHLGADHTWDLPRVLRVPGTMNIKPGRPPIRSRLIELAPDVRYDLDEIQAVLPKPAPARRWVAAPSQAPRLSARMERLIAEGNDGTYPSRSEADFAVACTLVRAGYGDEEIRSVFEQHPQGIGQKYAERGWTYLRCVIRGARSRNAS